MTPHQLVPPSNMRQVQGTAKTTNAAAHPSRVQRTLNDHGETPQIMLGKLFVPKLSRNVDSTAGFLEIVNASFAMFRVNMFFFSFAFRDRKVPPSVGVYALLFH